MYDDDNLDDIQNIARGLYRASEDVGESVGELRESLAELSEGVRGPRTKGSESRADPLAEPRATIELTEAELRYLVEEAYGTRDAIGKKFEQALDIETGPGGKFHDPA